METGDLIIDNSDDTLLLFMEWTFCGFSNAPKAYCYCFRSHRIYEYTIKETNKWLEVISHG